jgi:hypothetical protein
MKDGLKGECKSCVKTIIRETRDKKIKFCLEYKGGKCCDCDKKLSFPDNRGEYNFHHVDPSTKVYKLNQMFKDKLSDVKIIEELDKCVLLCKPCHVKRHKDFNNGLRESL